MNQRALRGELYTLPVREFSFFLHCVRNMSSSKQPSPGAPVSGQKRKKQVDELRKRKKQVDELQAVYDTWWSAKRAGWDRRSPATFT